MPLTNNISHSIILQYSLSINGYEFSAVILCRNLMICNLNRHEIDPNLHRSRDRILPWRIRKNFVKFSILNVFEIVTKCNKCLNKIENDVENYSKQLI